MAETVIIGAGIIGISTAFYLSEHQPGESIHIVETTDTLFASSSGYAGGFLARSWLGPASEDLGRLSFDQHKKLAEKYDGRKNWGYATNTYVNYQLPAGTAETLEEQKKHGQDWLSQGSSRAVSAPDAADDDDDNETGKQMPAWLRRRKGDHVDVLHDDGSTAIIDPKLFCDFFLKLAIQRGVKLHQPARVTSVGTDQKGELAAVLIDVGSESSGTKLEQITVPCTRLIIAAGAWSRPVFDSLFLGIDPDEEDEDEDEDGIADDPRRLPVSSYAGHSLLVRAPDAIKVSDSPGCHAVFGAGGDLGFSPEMFSRVGGDLYFAGLNSSVIPLPRRATDSKPKEVKIEQLLATCKEVLGFPVDEDNLKVLRKGLCFRPSTPWGAPLLVRLKDERLGGNAEKGKGKSLPPITTKKGANGGVFVAAGHGPWGISMAPGTGMVLAELVQGRHTSADIYGLDFHD